MVLMNGVLFGVEKQGCGSTPSSVPLKRSQDNEGKKQKKGKWVTKQTGG